VSATLALIALAGASEGHLFVALMISWRVLFLVAGCDLPHSPFLRNARSRIDESLRSCFVQSSVKSG